MTTASGWQKTPAPRSVEAVRQILKCRACDNPDLRPVISLGDQYIANFVRERDDSLPCAPLVLVRCEQCGLLQLQHSVDPALMWTDYWYRSGVNATMRAALKDVVTHALKFNEVGGVWIDIGANDGTLLSYVPREFSRIAVEPARTFTENLKSVADHVVPTFFSAEAIGHRRADVITSCAMFYDLDNPREFVQDIADSLRDDGIWINQLTDTVEMLETTGFDNIVHEHRCYYDVPALAMLYATAGLKIVSVTHNDINGGSFRVVASKQGDSATLGTRKVTGPMIAGFVDRTRRWKRLGEYLLFETPGIYPGPLWCYGASTKGSTLLQYLGYSDRFVGVADRNPAKHGLTMAGSWLPITDEITMRKAKPAYLLCLPWAFHEEFTQREASLRADGTTLIYPLPDWRFVL
jgi:NDP-4-keto-2,6-dideoxyhexose 3-C-methyltransferase